VRGYDELVCNGSFRVTWDVHGFRKALKLQMLGVLWCLVTWTGSVFVERLWRSPGEAYFTQQTLKGDRSEPVFSVLFEVQPQPDQWDAYLNYGRMLRPELERIKGFVDNVRYRSLTREGWILSLSGWRDEKALIRWRTNASHHGAQEKGRGRVLRDYHLRVGQITRDTRLPEG
jgi:heme-degrading monooxygenase HmoA